MRGMHFEHVEAGIERALRGLHMQADHVANVIRIHFLRQRCACLEGDRAGGKAGPGRAAFRGILRPEWGEAIPGCARGDLAAGMADLHRGHGAIGAQEIRDALPRLGLRVV